MSAVKIPEQYFATLADLAMHVKNLPGENDNWNNGFAGGSIEDALELASNGWVDGAKTAGDLATKIANRIVSAPSLVSVSRAIGFDVSGAAYDPGAYLSGVPECWSMLAPQESKRGVYIVANIGVSESIDNTVIRNRGYAVSALALSLQSLGYPVTIDVINNLKTYAVGSCRFRCRIADASSGAPLDIDRVTYALAHPTMLRRLCFAASLKHKSLESGAVEWAEDGRGGDSSPDNVDIYLGRVHLSEVNRWRDGGENWILEEFKKQTTV
jgi:hypothetical protein